MEIEEYQNPDRVMPSHPGFLIRTFLMKNFDLSISNIAEIMNTPHARAAQIIGEQEPLTFNDAVALKSHFGQAAVSLFRIQIMRDFFKENNRRPNETERETMFQFNAPLND